MFKDIANASSRVHAHICHDVITELVAVLKLFLKVIRCHPKKPASPQSDTRVGTGRPTPHILRKRFGRGLANPVFRGAVLVQIVEELFKIKQISGKHV